VNPEAVPQTEPQSAPVIGAAGVSPSFWSAFCMPGHAQGLGGGIGRFLHSHLPRLQVGPHGTREAPQRQEAGRQTPAQTSSAEPMPAHLQSPTPGSHMMTARGRDAGFAAGLAGGGAGATATAFGGGFRFRNGMRFQNGGFLGAD
jgi:hypothetical protein